LRRWWRSGGIHFPNPNRSDLGVNALTTCSLTALGRTLHARQDYDAHRGATPLLHYLTLTLVDELAASDAALVDRMLQDTVNLLREFKKECLRCCE